MRRERRTAPITVLCTSLDLSPARFAKKTWRSAISLEGKESEMKDKPAVCFRRLLNGEVLVEIVDGTGVVVTSRNVGTMAAGEFGRILNLMKLAEPEQLIATLSVAIELTVY